MSTNFFGWVRLNKMMSSKLMNKKDQISLFKEKLKIGLRPMEITRLMRDLPHNKLDTL